MEFDGAKARVIRNKHVKAAPDQGASSTLAVCSELDDKADGSKVDGSNWEKMFQGKSRMDEASLAGIYRRRRRRRRRRRFITSGDCRGYMKRVNLSDI